MIPFLPTTIPIPALEVFFKAAIEILPKIVPAIAGFIAKIPEPMMKKIIANTLDIVCDLAKYFLGCSDTPAELGDKALKAEKKPEDYDKISDYIKYLENEIKIDNKEFQNLTPDERRERELIGTEIYRQAIKEKIGFALTDDFLILCGKVGLDSKTVCVFVDELLKNRTITIDDVCSYFAGTCQPEKTKDIGDFCKNTLMKILDNPTPDKVNQMILSLMTEARKDN